MPGPLSGFSHFTLLLSAGGWLVILLAAQGLLALVGVVVAFLFRPPDVDGPGYYHILGFDKTTGTRRETTVRAESLAIARGRADLDGIVITEIKQVKESA